MRLFALRGAIGVESNDAGQILEGTAELMRTILERNGLATGDVVSCIFTVTDDLDAEFPAVAARAVGFDRVPLLCAREIPVPGSMPRVIRVLIHYYAQHEHEPVHVYLGGAEALRTDLQAAQ
jgi:chorismate mutase